MSITVKGAQYYFETPQKLKRAINKYFEDLPEDALPTVNDLCVKVGMTRQYFLKKCFENEEDFDGITYKEIVEDAVTRILAEQEVKAMRGKIKERAWIFVACNNSLGEYTQSTKSEVNVDANIKGQLKLESALENLLSEAKENKE